MGFTRLKIDNHKYNTNDQKNEHVNNNRDKNIHVMVPYTKGLSGNSKIICGKMGIQVYFKEGNPIKNILVAPIDKDIITQKRVIYRYKCNGLECDERYIGESARTSGERHMEHFRAPSSIYDHANITGH